MIKFEDIPDDLNGDVLRRMRRSGDSLTQSRVIDFSIVFPTEDAVARFIEIMHDNGLKASYKNSGVHDDEPWDATVKKDMVPDHAEIGTMEDWLEKHAAPLDGRNDGWGCFSMDDIPGS